jgi:hypothetical protein
MEKNGNLMWVKYYADARGGGGSVCSSHLKLHTDYLSPEQRPKLSKKYFYIITNIQRINWGVGIVNFMYLK